METLSLFVPVTEHNALLDRLADRATPVDRVGAELEALRCMRENVEEFLDTLDAGEVTYESLDGALRGLRASVAELRELDEGSE